MTIGRDVAPLAGLFVVGLGASLAVMDLAVNVAFPSITAAFALPTRSIRWVVICYVLTYASLMLAFGRLGDLIGHRRVFRAGLVVSVAAFGLCALAPDYRWLLVARVVQGVATALVMSCAPALATLLFDESKRTRALGTYAGLTALAAVIAPLVGGASIAALGWSGVFWFRAPVAVLALLLLPLLPQAHPPARSAPGHAFDFAGSVLLATGLALLLLALTLVQSAATAWHALALALGACAAMAAFAVHQRRAPEPILPLAAIRDPDFMLPNLASVAVHFVAFAVPLLVPYYLARVGGHSPVEIGTVLALSPIGILIGSTLVVPMARLAGPRRTALLGGVLVAAGSLSIALWPQMATPPVILCSLLLHGVGLGLFQVAYTDIVVATLPRRDRGVAGSLTLVMRTVGVMAAASVLTAALDVIQGRLIAAGAAQATAWVDAFGTVFLVSAVLLAAFFALSCLRPHVWFRR